jgi:hypothetical protein
MILVVHFGVPRPIDDSRKERVECLICVVVVGTSESSLVILEHQDANREPKRPQGTESDTEMESDIDLYREQRDVDAHTGDLHRMTDIILQ